MFLINIKFMDDIDYNEYYYNKSNNDIIKQPNKQMQEDNKKEDEKILKTVMKGGNTKETIEGTKIYKLKDYL